MELGEIELSRWGAFEGLVVPFARPPALTLIYGPNEAGKSTTLRAVTALLYGMGRAGARRGSDDAHEFERTELLLRGTVYLDGGECLRIERRRAGLFDERARELEPARWGALLAGIDAATYKVTFGLDGASLREGGAALLAGKGALATSLFAAATGAAHVHRVLAELAREADGLFAPRARTRPLNEAIRRVTDARKRVRAMETLPEAWLVQHAGVDAARLEAERVGAELRKLERDRAALELLVRAHEPARELAAARAERARLGDVPRGASSTREERLALERRVATSRARSSELEGELARRSAELATVSMPPSTELFAARLDEWLDQWLEEAARAEGEARLRPALRAELAALDARVASRAPSVAPTEAELARAKELVTRVLVASARVESAEQSLTELGRELEALGPAPDRELLLLLERALDEARDRSRSGEAARLAVVVTTLEREESEALGPARDAVLRLLAHGAEASLVVARATAAEQARAAVERGARALSSLEEALGARRNERARAWLEEGLVTREALAAARDERDRALTTLVERPDATSAAQVRALVRASDEAADARFERASSTLEAERLVTEVASLEDAQRAATSSLEALRREAHEASRALELALGVPNEDAAGEASPITPEHARELADRAARVRRARERRFGAQLELARATAHVDEAHATLTRALESLGEHATEPGSLEAHAQRALEGARARASLAASLEARRTALEAALAALVEERRVAEAELVELAASLGVPERAANVLAALEERVRLANDEKRRDELASRLTTLDDRERRLAESLASLSSRAPAELGARLAGREPGDVARELQRHRRELEARAALARERGATVARLTAELEREDAERARAGRALEALLAREGASSVEELTARERRVEEALAQEARELAADRGLRAAVGGEPGPGVEQAAAELDVEAARAKLVELDEAREELELARERAMQQRARLEEGLRQTEAKEGAAGAALEVEVAAGAARALARRYLRTRIAAGVLSSTIEAHRSAFEGPIVSRAGDRFAALTCGSFDGLAIRYDGALELCARRGEARLGVDALSEGTRDQLFLALRLATLEDFAARGGRLPVLCDDLLAHFDDERARAALVALSALAAHTQVIVLTHHARVVELARAALAPHALTVVPLTGRRAREAEQDEVAKS
jgi:uncharacterized protein YhaN